MGCVSEFHFSKRLPLESEQLVRIVCRLPGFSNKQSSSASLSLFFPHLHCRLSPMYAYIYIYIYIHINLGITLTWTSSGAWSAVKVILRCDPKGSESLCFPPPSWFFHFTHFVENSFWQNDAIFALSTSSSILASFQAITFSKRIAEEVGRKFQEKSFVRNSRIQDVCLKALTPLDVKHCPDLNIQFYRTVCGL